GGPQARSGRRRPHFRRPHAAPVPTHPGGSGRLARLDLDLARRRGTFAGGVRALRALEDKAGRVAPARLVAVPSSVLRGRTGRGAELLFGAGAVSHSPDRVSPERTRPDPSRCRPPVRAVCDRLSV